MFVVDKHKRTTPAMAKTYAHLSLDERFCIRKWRNDKCSISEIARRLQRAKSSIATEIKRNSYHGGYEPKRADGYAKKRRKTPRTPSKQNNPEIAAFVGEHLARQHSPEQIAGRMKALYPSRPDMRVSAAALYRWIEKDRAEGGTKYRDLRINHHKRKRPRKKSARRARIADRTMITERPAEVDAKERLGDWEGDTVVGPHGTTHALVTLVDRRSRYLQIVLVANKQALTLNAAVLARFRRRRDLTRHTLTVDNGLEFAQHKALSKGLKAAVFFAHPGCSWERGLSENTNGLIRQYFPKGTDFSRVTAQRVAQVEALLNNRPRKSLDYRTPTEYLESNRKPPSRRAGVRLAP